MTGSPFWDACWIFAGGAGVLAGIFLLGAYVREQWAETRHHEALRERQRTRHLRPWERDVPGFNRDWRRDD